MAGALGPFVPVEAWPPGSRAAISQAYVEKAAAAAERIRQQVRNARCSCFRPGERLAGGCCGRCYGVHPEGRP